MSKRINLVGQRFGRLLVKRFVGSNKHRQSKWECVCDCGNTSIVSTTCLRRSKCPTKSCGCIRPGITVDENGKATRLYRIWCGMKQRCFGKNSKDYERYGGRGITICKEWLNYANFHSWAISKGYADNLTIERSNNNGSYEPANCKWVLPKFQARNRRNNHLLSLEGETLTIAEWAEIMDVDRGVIEQRLMRGWSVKKTLTTPIQKKMEGA